jgi:hypothetical protein
MTRARWSRGEDRRRPLHPVYTEVVAGDGRHHNRARDTRAPRALSAYSSINERDPIRLTPAEPLRPGDDRAPFRPIHRSPTRWLPERVHRVTYCAPGRPNWRAAEGDAHPWTRERGASAPPRARLSSTSLRAGDWSSLGVEWWPGFRPPPVARAPAHPPSPAPASSRRSRQRRALVRCGLGE